MLNVTWVCYLSPRGSRLLELHLSISLNLSIFFLIVYLLIFYLMFCWNIFDKFRIYLHPESLNNEYPYIFTDKSEVNKNNKNTMNYFIKWVTEWCDKMVPLHFNQSSWISIFICMMQMKKYQWLYFSILCLVTELLRKLELPYHGILPLLTLWYSPCPSAQDN